MVELSDRIAVGEIFARITIGVDQNVAFRAGEFCEILAGDHLVLHLAGMAIAGKAGPDIAPAADDVDHNRKPSVHPG